MNNTSATPEDNSTAQRVFVISAPSGTGKTTLHRRLVSEYPEVEIAISYTTRSIRPGETDGVQYHFIDKNTFAELLDGERMLEWAHVHGELYGTGRDELERIHSAKKTPILEIDVQGWQQCAPILPQARSLFLLPPTLRQMWQRLAHRGTDSLAKRYTRLCNGKEEIAQAHTYQEFLINDNLDTTYRQLSDIVLKDVPSPMTREQGLAHCRSLLAEYEQSDWLNEVKETLKKQNQGA